MRLNVKTTLLFFLFSATLLTLNAQTPVNDDCSGLIDLGVAPYCPDVTIPGNETEIYSNVDATESDIGFGNNPSCFNGGTPQRDVWFAFTTSDTIFDYTITVMGVEGPDGEPSIVNPQVALYRGACEVNNLAELLCASADPGETMIELDAEGLTPGITYYLRINDYSGTATPNSGSFKLCIDQQDPINLITEGGSTSCTGELFDSGGPDEDYENNENSVFTICPNQPNQCINFTLEYYNMEYNEFTITDQLIFYDGEGTDPNTIITTLGGQNLFFSTSANSGVCFEVQATSGCMTVQFISDGQTTFEGFAGSWECSTEACDINDPINVDPDATALQIEQALSTPFTQTSVVSIDCNEAAYGTFVAGDDTDLGLGTGLLLTSGLATTAIGPNNNPGGFLGDLGEPGDQDLDSLSILYSTGELSQDACVIELDVFANTNELAFEYVFGSEEYPEFVNETFNDIFAFLISGPGIDGIPGLNGQDNIAVIPNTNTFVEINSVNNLVNWEYYRNNEVGQSIQYDGLTSDFLGVKKSLTARSTVEPCNTYRLKLAIADRGDGAFDSGVFISELSGGSPQIIAQFNSGIDYLVEDCTDEPDEVIFILNNPDENPVTYAVTIGGTATFGLDYLLEVPSEITFLPGLNEISFPITVLSDLLMEDTETILISLNNDFGCGIIELASLEILIEDELVVDINDGLDTLRVCAGGSAMLEVDGATTYFWTPVNVFDDPLSNMPTVTPAMSQWVFVEGQVGNFCMDTDSIFLEVLDPVIDIEQDTIVTCQTQPVLLEAMNNTNGQSISWSPTTGVDNPNSATTMANPQFTTQYVATMDLGFGCVVTDTVIVLVDFFNVPELTNDTTICENFGVTLSSLNDPNTTATTYSWTPEAGLDDPSSPTPIAFPDVTTTYELTATTLNEACTETSTVTVTVLPADVEITNEPDTLLLCLGDSVVLTAQTSLGNNENFFWSPDDGSLSSTTDLVVTATPITNTTYFTNYTVGACVVIDSIFIQVDSLPEDMSIVAEPFEDPYCPDELVTLVSPTYEPALYPNITHEWIGLGLETADTLYNMVFTTQDSFLYQRTTVNGACVQVDEIQINVINADAITITPIDAVICPGDEVQLLATADSFGDLEWSPAETLSCDDCPDPIATPSNTTTYTLSSDVEGCVVEQSVTVTVQNPDAFSPIPSQTLCAGDLPIALNPNADPEATYVWTSNPVGFNSTDPNPVVNPAVSTTYIGTATNVCGSATEEITLTLIDPGSIISIAGGAETITVCSGEEFTLNAVLDNSDNGVETITWIYDGESEVGTDATFTATQSGLATFNYQYGITAVDDCEVFSETVFIQVNEAPQQVAVIEDVVICSGVDSTFSLFTGTVEPGVSYTWTGSNGEVFMEADPEVTPSESVTYTLEATLGECTTTAEVNVTIIAPVTLVIDPASDQLIQDGITTLNLFVEAPNTDNPNVEWTFDNQDIGTGGSIQWTPGMTQLDSLPGFVFAMLTNDCQSLTDSLFIQKLQYRVPNIFSPNGDGNNDVFKPFYLGEMDMVEVIVYNRWGNVVFESDDPNNPGWDGMKDGKPAPSDVYIYLVRVGLGGETVEQTGEITLVR